MIHVITESWFVGNKKEKRIVMYICPKKDNLNTVYLKNNSQLNIS